VVILCTNVADCALHAQGTQWLVLIWHWDQSPPPIPGLAAQKLHPDPHLTSITHPACGDPPGCMSNLDTEAVRAGLVGTTVSTKFIDITK